MLLGKIDHVGRAKIRLSFQWNVAPVVDDRGHSQAKPSEREGAAQPEWADWLTAVAESRRELRPLSVSLAKPSNQPKPMTFIFSPFHHARTPPTAIMYEYLRGCCQDVVLRGL